MLNKHDKKYKEYLRLLDRWDIVSKEINKVPKVKLDKPYQRGWVIKYDLRPDIKRRKDIADILFMLETAYHSSIYTNNVNWVKAIRRGEKTVEVLAHKKRIKVDLCPGRRRLSQKQFDSLPNKFKDQFYLDKYSDVYTRYGRKEYIASLPGYWLVLKARPNMVTYLKGKACDLETEYTEIKNKLYLYWATNTRGSGGSHPRTNGRTDIRSAIQKFKKGEIDDIFNEKPPTDYDY